MTPDPGGEVDSGFGLREGGEDSMLYRDLNDYQYFLGVPIKYNGPQNPILIFKAPRVDASIACSTIHWGSTACSPGRDIG